MLTPGSVLVVDEAGMVGTRDLATLTRAAEDAQAKLVLVGDDRQLPEIQAGGAFRALAAELGAVELREVRRQHEPWDRDALAALRQGDVETFAAAYEQHGRLIVARNADEARAAMVRGWCGDAQRGRRDERDGRPPPAGRRRAQRPGARTPACEGADRR